MEKTRLFGRAFWPQLPHCVCVRGEKVRTGVPGAAIRAQAPKERTWDELLECARKPAFWESGSVKMSLTADDSIQIHPFLQTGDKPVWEFEIPQEAVKDGKLVLTWRAAPGERGAQVAEVWLMRK